ncbi:MAG: hypothetical protein V2I35_03690 [Desulfocapsaceae bacterium]|jgi:hypothetical protein|nr:hypothetical protein [Desulfocapsaceae bacterium]
MKKILYLCVSLFLSFSAGAQTGECSQSPESIDPCSLDAAEKLSAIFPALQKAEKQSVGLQTVCNYLDGKGIPALIISVSKSTTTVRETLSMLGPGYVIEDIDSLGDEAAIAIQQENPKFGLKEGIAALHVKKKNLSLNFSFFRINLIPTDEEFEDMRMLAAEIIEKL